MNAEETEKGMRERALVDMSKPEEVTYWEEQFGTNRAALEAAVSAVGCGVEAVEARLKLTKT